MENIKQHDHRTTPPPRLRDGNPHGEYRSCRVRLFQERHHQHRRRQDGEGTGSEAAATQKKGDLTAVKKQIYHFYRCTAAPVPWYNETTE